MSGFRQEDIDTMYMSREYVIVLFLHFIGLLVLWLHV